MNMQKAVESETDKLMKEGHIGRLEEVREVIFISFLVVTRKSDGSVKKAIDAVELNRQNHTKANFNPVA